MTSRDFLSSFVRNSSSTPYLSFSVKYYLTSNICLSLYQDQIDFLLSWPNPDSKSNHTPLLSFKGWVEPCRSPPLLHVTIQVASLVHAMSSPARFHQLLVAITSSFPKHQPNRGHTASGLVLSVPQRTGWAALCTSLERVGILSTLGNSLCGHLHIKMQMSGTMFLDTGISIIQGSHSLYCLNQNQEQQNFRRLFCASYLFIHTFCKQYCFSSIFIPLGRFQRL